MITACVALVGVSVLAIWVAQRGGRIAAGESARLGVQRAFTPGLPLPPPDAGAPEDAAAEVPHADAGVPPDAAADASLDEEDAGEEEAADAAAPSVTPQSPKAPPKKKKPVKRPRRR